MPHTVNPPKYPAQDSYGNLAGFANGVVYAYSNTLAYTDTTAKAMFILPKGAVVTNVRVTITTVFNSSGTDLLTLGDGTTADLYVDDLSGATAGNYESGDASTLPMTGLWTTPLTADTLIYGLFTQSVADASTGACRMTVHFRVD